MKKPSKVELILAAGLLYGVLERGKYNSDLGESIEKVAKWLLEEA